MIHHDPRDVPKHVLLDTANAVTDMRVRLQQLFLNHSDIEELMVMAQKEIFEYISSIDEVERSMTDYVTDILSNLDHPTIDADVFDELEEVFRFYFEEVISIIKANNLLDENFAFWYEFKQQVADYVVIERQSPF